MRRPLTGLDTCSDHQTTLKPTSGGVRETVGRCDRRYYLREVEREGLALARGTNTSSGGQVLRVLKTTPPRYMGRGGLVSDDVVYEEALDQHVVRERGCLDVSASPSCRTSRSKRTRQAILINEWPSEGGC